MSEAAWTALTQIITALFALLAALFAHNAGSKAQGVSAKLEAHEAASAARGRDMLEAVKAAEPRSRLPVGGRIGTPPADLSEKGNPSSRHDLIDP